MHRASNTAQLEPVPCSCTPYTHIGATHGAPLHFAINLDICALRPCLLFSSPAAPRRAHHQYPRHYSPYLAAGAPCAPARTTAPGVPCLVQSRPHALGSTASPLRCLALCALYTVSNATLRTSDSSFILSLEPCDRIRHWSLGARFRLSPPRALLPPGRGLRHVATDGVPWLDVTASSKLSWEPSNSSSAHAPLAQSASILSLSFCQTIAAFCSTRCSSVCCETHIEMIAC